MPTKAVAWVESPLQLLSVVEAHHAGLLGDETVVVPRRGASTLDVVCAEVVSLDPPAGLTVGDARSRPRRGPVRHRSISVFGDPFSGVVQAALLSGPIGRVVIVDDGLATGEFVRRLTDRGGPSLSRPREANSVVRRVLGRVSGARLARMARRGGVAVASALPFDESTVAAARGRGVEITRTDFGWLGSRRPSPPPWQRRIVLGTALVENGLLAGEPYLGWVRDASEDEPVAYIPHRREGPRTLEVLAGLDNVDLGEPGLPVELTLRSLRPDQEVLSLPSTAVVSLRLVLAASGAKVVAVPVPDGWWTPEATPEVRQLLTRYSSAGPTS